MKASISKLLILALTISGITVLSSCENFNSNDKPVEYTTILDVQEDGTSAIIESELKSVALDEPVTSESDEALLLHMKDEEKLARDVYAVLFEKWSAQIFQNIGNAEQKHLDAILLLINTYSTLVVDQGEAGRYDNPDFQLLYDQLVSDGSESIEEAYRVGALIEELDIYDLENYLTQTSSENITLVFENLMRGSRNHLRAFNRNLEMLGLSYEPQYLDEITFSSIINSPMEQGKRYAKRNGKQHGRGGNGGNGLNGGNGDGTCNY